MFQGVPRPPSQALGHWPTQPVRGSERRADAAEAGPDLDVDRAVQAALLARREVDAEPARRQRPFEPAGQGAGVAAVAGRR